MSSNTIPTFQPTNGHHWERKDGAIYLVEITDNAEYHQAIPSDSSANEMVDLLRAKSATEGWSSPYIKFLSPEEETDLQRITDRLRSLISSKFMVVARSLLPKAEPVNLDTPTSSYLLEMFEQLGDNGKRVAVEVVKRLLLGHKSYGDFPARKWTRESREEQIDNAVYMVVDTIHEEGRLECQTQPQPQSYSNCSGSSSFT